MIVRCTNCNSAFAVDDAKVEDKKFAFTCPKCNYENIVDNRRQSKPSFTGPAIVDEAYYEEEKEPVGLKEAVLDRGKKQPVESGADRDRGDADKPLFDDLTLPDSDDLSGLAEPEHFEETGTSSEISELPPADDMHSEIPLDDLVLDSELADLDMPEEKQISEDMALDVESKASDDAGFEELGDELDNLKSDSSLIHDELEAHDEAGEPVTLEEIDDIDKLLEEKDDKKREIIDEFAPLEGDMAEAASESPEADMALNEEIKAEEMYRAEDKRDDESITIDLDSLDIDLDEAGEEPAAKKSGVALGGAARGDMRKTHTAAAVASNEDENITIDLDSLDIELQEEKEVLKGESHDELDLDLSDFSEETLQELEDVTKAPKAKDNENITLDLNSLDISLEENDEIMRGEALDGNEKLTLEDAGLTLEELTTDEMTLASTKAGKEERDEEDIRLSLDEIDPNLDMQTIEKELKEAESILSESPDAEDDLLIVDELSDLPELDIDDELNLEEGGAAATARTRRDDELIRLDESERVSVKKGGLQKAIPDMASHGAVNFSIDYSIKYSRAGAVLRILGLFFLGLVPHYLVFLIYAILSVILGFINHIVVIATMKNIEDFSEIHENTLRYLLSISASAIGIVEEMPIFAGRSNIDYPLQLKINYPLRSQRLFAFLRLSGIGILLIMLPHFIILGILSLVIPIVFMIGIFSVLITGGWPHILFDFMSRYYRYLARVMAFTIGIVDVYPKFKFE